MITPVVTPTKHRDRGLYVYNLRILLGNSYWLIITPIVVAQLVLFWNIATSGLANAARAVQTVEMLAPILGALLCAYTVAPEHRGVGELVFVRPIALEKLLLLRLTAVFAFVLVLLVPPLVIYRITVPGFPVILALLSGLVSALFLSALAMALASATRQPLLGLGIASAFWTFDLLLGSQFNSLLTLHTLADHLAGTPMSELWLYGKTTLLFSAAVLYLWNRRLLGRPVAPRRARVVLRNLLLVLALLLGYLYTGAAAKVGYLMQREGSLGNQAWLAYQQAFRVYGPLPVPWLFGPAFPLYLRAELGHASPPTAAGTHGAQHLKQMQLLLDRYPRSIWADNAAFELARARSQRTAGRATTLLVYRLGEAPVKEVVESDQLGMAEALLSFAEAYPSSPFAPIALVQRANIGEALLDFAMATESYQRIMTRYPHSSQAAEAGLSLSVRYRREGRRQEALRAATVAADAAGWEASGSAFLVAANAALEVGDSALARDLCQRARNAAVAARRRAGERARGGGTRLSPAQIIHESESVMRQADSALSGELGTTPPPPHADASLVGRLTRNGAGMPDVRIAVGQPGPMGYPSPFTPDPSAQATTDQDGVFELTGLALGGYRSLALSLPGWYQSWELTGLALPLQVGASRAVLPLFSLVHQTQEPPLPTRPSAVRGATGHGGRGGGRTGARGGGRLAQRGGPQRGPRDPDRAD